MIHDRCEGCRYDLGGGCCRINMEAECGAGERELWEDEKADAPKSLNFLISAVTPEKEIVDIGLTSGNRDLDLYKEARELLDAVGYVNAKIMEIRLWN